MPIRPENKNKYPKCWDDISRRIRFERAGGKCESCGVENYSYIEPKVEDGKTARVVLTVAHLDHNPANCDGMDRGGQMLPKEKSNLRAWCQKCHNSYDAPMRLAGIRERAAKDQLKLF